MKETVEVAAVGPTQIDMSFAERTLMRKAQLKRRRMGNFKYRSTEHVLPTSNSCERLFSASRLIMSYLRSGIDCASCEMLLFLKLIYRLREDPKLIDDIMLQLSQARLDEDDDVDE